MLIMGFYRMLSSAHHGVLHDAFHGVLHPNQCDVFHNAIEMPRLEQLMLFPIARAGLIIILIMLSFIEKALAFLALCVQNFRWN